MRKFSRILIPAAVVFVGWTSACSETPRAPDPLLSGAEQAVLTKCPYLDPLSPDFTPGVVFDEELLIRDLSVVDDPCRTSWTGSCASGGTQGIWTFGEMITRIAGTGSPQALVAAWLHQWEINLNVNGFAIPPRPNVRAQLIEPWLAASGCVAGAPIVGAGACALDLEQAPFRLLAIVNRSDLECADPLAPGSGEARLVFGILDRDGDPLQGTVIFEFTLPPFRGGVPYTTMQWQHDWHVLHTMPFRSRPYLMHLEHLLDDITAVGANPGGPNLGTSLAQVRTNEIAFGGGIWKMRENRLQDVGAGSNAMQLLATVTAETPDDSLNRSPALDTFLSTNAAALASFTQPSVPVNMPGGESSMPLPTPPFWNHSGVSPLTPAERHHFAFKTCNGCHFSETNTTFLHIGNRNPGAMSVLSPFLATSTTPGSSGLPASHLLVLEPWRRAPVAYNEPWRRVCEASRMLKGHTACWSKGNGAH